MKLNRKVCSAIQSVLNSNGWRGYRKELAERVDIETGALTFNYAKYEDNDLNDKMTFQEWGAVDLDPVNGVTELDIWLYKRDFELVDTRSVWVYDLGNGHIVASLEELEPNQILQKAVEARSVA